MLPLFSTVMHLIRERRFTLLSEFFAYDSLRPVDPQRSLNASHCRRQHPTIAPRQGAEVERDASSVMTYRETQL